MERLAFVLGKPPRPGTVVGAVVDALRGDGFTVAVHLPHEDGVAVPELEAAALVVQRGLRRAVLAELRAVESAGVRCCNPIAATIAVADRLGVAQRLAAAGVPVPPTGAAASWAAVGAVAGGSLVVKCRDGDVGRGARVLIVPDGRAPYAPPFPGPWLLQRFVPGDGTVHKLYVAGRRLRGLRKPAAGTGADRAAAPVPFTPSPALAELARLVGSVLGLEIYDVDVIVGPDGPCVVDVNPFPGFRAVPDAVALVAGHVRSLATAAR